MLVNIDTTLVCIEVTFSGSSVNSLFQRFMAKKLYAFASGECMAESADSPMNQEILLGGHFYLMVLKVLGLYHAITVCVYTIILVGHFAAES